MCFTGFRASLTGFNNFSGGSQNTKHPNIQLLLVGLSKKSDKVQYNYYLFIIYDNIKSVLVKITSDVSLSIF